VVRTHALAAIVFIALSVLMTWPLATALDRAVAYPGDPFINTWILDWDWYATLHQPLSLFQGTAFYPAKDSLAFSENLYGIAVFLAPVRALGASPLFAHNLAILLGFAFSGFGAYILGYTVTRSAIAGVVAGIFYAFVPFRFTHLPHVQHVWSGWLPLLLAALIAYGKKPSWRNASLFGVAFLFNGLSNIHWLLFGTFAIACSIPVALRAWRDAVRLIVAGAVAIALLTPFLLPYREVASLYGMKRSWHEAKEFSAAPRDWLQPGITNRLYARFADTKVNAERWLFPGALSILFSIAGLIEARRNRRTLAIALIWIALGVLGSLGTNTFFHRFLFTHVPGFRAIRVPARWANIAYAGISMLVAFTVAWMSRNRRWVGAVAAGLFLVELHAAPIRWYCTSPNVPPVNRWLARQDVRIVELPLDVGPSEYYAMLHATAHHRPMANGISGFTPPELGKLIELARTPIGDGFVDDLRRIGVDTIVVHADLFPDREWLRRELARGRLFFVRRFTNPIAIDGDWVFSTRGGASMTSDLATMLRQGYTANDDTFGLLDYPNSDKPLGYHEVFTGWALSPYGIRSVDFLFDNGRVRMPAKFQEDRGLSGGMPFYPQTPRPRYVALFEQRPKGVRRVTDVQVEIVDGRGVKTFLEGRFIIWND
jgi:hypothetical protein